MQKRSRTINGIWTAVLTVLSLAWIYPIVMVVINSFKVESAISTSTARSEEHTSELQSPS